MPKSTRLSPLILIALMAATCGTPQTVTKGSLVLENKVCVVLRPCRGDEKSDEISFKRSDKTQIEMQYSGQSKVTVIRENMFSFSSHLCAGGFLFGAHRYEYGNAQNRVGFRIAILLCALDLKY